MASDKLPCTETDEVVSIAVQTFAVSEDIFLVWLFYSDRMSSRFVSLENRVPQSPSDVRSLSWRLQ